MADNSTEQQQFEEGGVGESRSNRLGAFLRSVLPVDRWQLVFIAGLICLTVAPRLRWWPTGIPVRVEWAALTTPVMFVLIAGAAVGYALLLWRVRRPGLWLWLGVCLPTSLAGIALFVRNFFLEGSPHSILDKSGWTTDRVQRELTQAWSVGTGAHAWAIGLLLVALFAIRVSMGIARLPFQLPDEADKLENRPKILLWLVIGPQFVLFSALGFLSLLSSNTIFVECFAILESVIEIALALWIMGKEGRAGIRKLVRLPEIRWVGLAVAVPVTLALVLPLGRFVHDRAQWAAFGFGRVEPPYLPDYLPRPHLLFVFTSFFAAAFEELVFRGMLQPLFGRKYGTLRGVFLTCMAWAAFHFYWEVDFRARASDLHAIEQVIFRIAMCLAIGFVLSWLTAQSGSLLPATLAHWFYNLLLPRSDAAQVPYALDIVIAMWAVVAVVLYRFWPLPAVKKPNEGVSVSADALA